MRGGMPWLALTLTACTSEPPVPVSDPFGAASVAAGALPAKPTLAAEVK